MPSSHPGVAAQSELREAALVMDGIRQDLAEVSPLCSAGVSTACLDLLGLQWESTHSQLGTEQGNVL